MILVPLAGLLLGLVLGAVGGGGAVLAVPILVHGFGQTVHEAATGSLVVVIGAATAGAAANARLGLVCWRLVAVFAAAALPGAALGTAANRLAPEGLLTAAFAVLLLAAAFSTWRRATITATAADAEACPRPGRRVLAAAVATGLLTGLLGVGGGFAVVPVLVLGLRVPLRRAIGTSLAVVAITATAGLGTHLAAGSQPAWTVVLPLALMAAAGALLGARAGRRLPRVALARTFAIVLGVTSAFLLAGALLA